MEPIARRTLSSATTWLYKFFWPAFNLVVFIGGSILVWGISAKQDHDLIWLARFGLPVIGVGSTAYGIWYGRRLMRVEMDDDALYVSNYRREIRVTFSEIENCSVSWEGQRASVPVVTIELRQSTAFGRQIVFIAAKPWDISHSIVAELRDRANGRIALGKTGRTP